MPSPVFSKRLTATDASFLYIEKKAAPMHIGAVGVLDRDLTLAEMLANVEPRLPRLPQFRQRIVTPAFNAGHPTWVNDPNFDLRKHLIVHDLGGDADDREMERVVGSIFSEPLPRDRPLWALHLIRGLAGGRSAVVSSLHHAMVDGVGGNEIMGALFDIDDQPKLPPVTPFKPDPLPRSETQFLNALWDSTSTVVDAWAKNTTELLQTLRLWPTAEAAQSRRALRKAMPRMMSPLRRLPFNRRCSGKREMTWCEFSFAEARAIRANLKMTVNDVVLTVLAGAISDYAKLHGQSVGGRKARVMVPVNFRQAAQEGALGNQVSMLMVNLPLGISDPLERAKVISATMTELKESGMAGYLHQATNFFTGLVPAGVQSLVASLANPSYPAANFVCTNIPGPQIPLYFAGRKLVRYLPTMPTGYEVGFSCPVFTYNQTLVMGIAADTGACPDFHEIKRLLDASFDSLRTAAGVGQIDPIEIKTRSKSARTPEIHRVPPAKSLSDRKSHTDRQVERASTATARNSRRDEPQYTP